MVRNPVAANLLMLFLLVGGFLFSQNIRQEIFPAIEQDVVSIVVNYPGAAPDDVESGACLPIEEAIFGVGEIKEIYCVASEGSAKVTVTLIHEADLDSVLQKIKAEIDRIRTFPQGIEQPVVSIPFPRSHVISVAVYGNVSERSLREQAELVREELLKDSHISQVGFRGVRDYEISIEIDETTLQKYGLTLELVANRIKEATVDLPGGKVKTRGGEISLRVREHQSDGNVFSEIRIVTLADGTEVRLSDIATIRDGFEELEQACEFDGKPAAIVKVFRVGDQRPIEIAKIVQEFVSARKSQVPKGIELSVLSDRSEALKSRFDILFENIFLGICLVFLVLGAFLEWRLAFWVMLGIPISFLGSFLLLPSANVTINVVSLFAFILALGIVVDDAIIVGESIFEHRKRGKSPVQAAIDGVLEVKTAVIFSVLTSMIAFSPMLLVPGMTGKLVRLIPVIVISVLSISLVESFLILPSHLAHSAKQNLDTPETLFANVCAKFRGFMQALIDGPYRKSVRWSLENSYLTVAIALSAILVSAGLLFGGYTRLIHMPNSDADFVTANLQMPVGGSSFDTKRHLQDINSAARRVISGFQKEEELPVARNTYSLVGTTLGVRGGGVDGPNRGGHLAASRVVLQSGSQRSFSSSEFAQKWRDELGGIPGARALDFNSSFVSMGDDIKVQLEHEKSEIARIAAGELRDALLQIEGIDGARINLSEGKRELSLRLLPSARTLGITELDLARQLRAAFHGFEAFRMLRGKEELSVVVRYPQNQRRSLGDVDSLRVRTSDGGEVPFAQVAMVAEGKGFSQIRRNNRRRVLSVSAVVDENEVSPREVISTVSSTVLPELIRRFPGLSYSLDGEERERRESTSSLLRGFALVLLLIYILLAVPLKSYVQPLIITAAIPFGIVGAIIGHVLLGHDISMLSMFGVVALSGVVVNDSLLLVDHVNQNRDGYDSLYEALVEGGCRRFRQIVLTSVTTFFGLAPIIFETNIQAQYLIPMAISLGFGILFATVITLYLVPSLYLLVEDLRILLGADTGRSPS